MELDESDIRALMRAAGAGRAHGGAPGSSLGSQSRADGEGLGDPNMPRPNRQEPGVRRGPGARNRKPKSAAPKQPDPLYQPGLGGANAGSKRRNAPFGDRPVERSGDRSPNGAQPDPMKTSLGYIGADSFNRQRQGPAGGGPRRGGGGPGGSRRGGGRGPR